MTTEERYRRILANHLPAGAVDWVYDYLNLHKVHFHITQERRSKLGDYRWPQSAGGRDHPFHEISVNGDLGPYRFLWVFLHEAAHLETHLRHGHSVQPHGHEWQGEYCRLLREHLAFFPGEVQPLVARFARRVPMERAVGRQAEEALRRFEPGYTAEAAPLTLDRLQPGVRFRLRSKPALLFEAQERRRTRWLCLELTSGRQYTVNGAAEVEVEEP